MVRTRGEQVHLTPAVILDQALAVADVEGLDAITVRRLARDLEVTPMALYWHFKGKEELLDALADRLVSDVELTFDEAASWQRQLRTLLDSLIVVLRAHPFAAGLVGVRNNASEPALRATEVVLDVLRRGGFSPADATHIARQAVRTTAALVTAQPGFAPTMSAGDQRRMQDRTRAYLRALPAERFPRVIEAAEPLSACDDPDAYYERGLTLFLAGIESAASQG